MSEIVERVKKATSGWTVVAIDGYRVMHGIVIFGKLYDSKSDALMAMDEMRARAAIEAMLEPTPFMEEAGQIVCNDAYVAVDELPADAHFVWKAMLRAALTEANNGQ